MDALTTIAKWSGCLCMVWMLGCSADSGSETASAQEEDSATSEDSDSNSASGDSATQDASTDNSSDQETDSNDGNDLCPEDPNKTEPGECGCGAPEGSCSGIIHVGTTVVYDPNGQDVTIDRPSGSQSGDLLVLALHRTDDDLPLFVDGWTRVAECYKRDNGYDCSTAEDCTVWHNDDFCQTFGDEGQGAHDLAQSVFVRAVDANEPSSYQFNLNVDNTGHPGWAILTALRGAATVDPVRDWANVGCDGDAHSVFPSVYVEKGDMVLLSQSFDDAVAQAKFSAPAGMMSFGYVTGEKQYVSEADQNATLVNDETGFLFGGILDAAGETGELKTTGDGASNCKDALVSLAIRPK